MPNIDRHEPGAFCWFELGTTDQPAAKTFYSDLFGWTSEDFPMGPSGSYTMFRLDGRDVGAAYTSGPEQGVHWNIYISVNNADETAKRAGELGGSVLMPAFDVMEAGRMSVITDPTGATFCIWQPKRHNGVGLSGVDGTVCWADLSTPDTAEAKTFYERLFHWRIERSGHDDSGYLHIQNGEDFIGGMPPAEHRKAGVPPHWMLYFLTSDCAATAQSATEMGAKALMPTQEVPHVGTMAILRDPQGAVFALFQPLKAAA